MEEKMMCRLSDEAIIEIVHGIKEVLIELIDRSFSKGDTEAR